MADAIAAGEVIERPASVVKELVENALDAGARRITVEIEAGGADLVRVVDDGAGMSPGELALAFSRHATSKLARVEDLSHISTFGFRGEALASIAAAADVVAVSRPPDLDRGTRLELVGSSPRRSAPTPAPPGTAVDVLRLFSRTPARRRFLRSPRSEAAACLRVVEEAALGRPEVAFELLNQGRRTFSAPGRGGLFAAARAVWGGIDPERLLTVSSEQDGVSVSGLLGSPELARGDRQALVLLVDGRRVHQRSLAAAVEGAFRGLLPVGRYPLAVLDLRCPPDEVDVNVHPAKREVRLRREGQVFEALQRACWETLQRAPAKPLSVDLVREPFAGPPAPPTGLALGEQLPESPPRAVSDGPLPGSLAEAAGWRYLAQARRRYLVAETGHGIALLDQHAAHEKVIYARVLERLRSEAAGPAPQQGLLEPLLLEVGGGGVQRWEAMAALLDRAGFRLTAFGERTVRCSAAPVGTSPGSLPELLRELLSGEAPAGSELEMHRTAAAIACHSAVRFGDRVGQEEAERLLRDLALTPGGITCPHGRPAVLFLSEATLLASFGRR